MSKCVTASRGVAVSRDCLVGSLAVAADRRLDPPAPRARPPADEREVLAFERAPPNEALQTAERLLATGDDEQARRIAVETVHDAGALGRPASRPTSAQRTGERPVRTTGSGMDDDAGGLVDDEQMLVLPGDARVPRARASASGSGAASGSSKRTSSPPASRWLFGRATPSTSTVSPGDEPLRGRSGAHGRLLGEEPIQPQPRGRLGYAKRDQERSVDAPCRRRGLRSPASIVPTRRTTPTMMQTSAMLKAGQ